VFFLFGTISNIWVRVEQFLNVLAEKFNVCCCALRFSPEALTPAFGKFKLMQIFG